MGASRQRWSGNARLRPTRRSLSSTGLTAGTLLAALLVLLAGVLPLTRAGAAPLRSCTPTHGTIVAVDFAHWGGPIVRGCGLGRRSGYALLHAAGFTTAGDAHDGNGIICRLGDETFRRGTQYPTPRQQSCVNTPPTTAYWAFWVAPPGSDHWSYSPLGAMGDVTKPGEVELWIFGGTDLAGTHGSAVPTFPPSSLRAGAAVPPSGTTSTARGSGTTSTARGSGTTSTTRNRGTGSTRTHPSSSAARPERSHRSATRTTASATTRTTAPRSGRTYKRNGRTGAHRRAGSAAPQHRTAGSPQRSHGSGGARSRTGTGGPGGARTPPTSHPATTSTSPGGHRRGRHPRARGGASRTLTASSTTTAGSPAVVAAQPTSRRASAGSPTPLIIGAVLIALLGAGAVRAMRLRRREE